MTSGVMPLGMGADFLFNGKLHTVPAITSHEIDVATNQSIISHDINEATNI